ncbi:MAG: hypothetical protein JWO59_753 [Chloroflexi bacterium]|nr:hypothetical protein [Chloroflexota bacterium]
MPDPILFTNASGPGTGSPLDAAVFDALVVSGPALRSGTLPASSASLTLAMPQFQAVINTGLAAKLVTVPAGSLTVSGGASTDNYIYVDLSGTYSQLAVSHGVAAPATPAGTNCLCYATTNAGNTAISSVTRVMPTSGLPTPTPSYIVQMQHARQTVDNNSLTSTSKWTDYPNLPIAINATAGNTLVVEALGSLWQNVGSAFFAVNINGVDIPICRSSGPAAPDPADSPAGFVCGVATALVAATGAQVVKLRYYVNTGTVIVAPSAGDSMSLIVTEHL